MRQIKEKMGDCMNIVVEKLVSLPKEDREKVLSQYISNVDEKVKKMAEEKGGGKGTECHGSPTGTLRGLESGKADKG